MPDDGVKATRRSSRRRASTGGTLVVTFVVACAAGTAVLAVPRPVVPGETPGLRLPEAEMAEAVSCQRALLARLPEGPFVERLRSIYREHALAEVQAAEGPEATHRRIAALAGTARRVRDAHGEEALWALRAEATEALEAARAGRLGPEERDGLLGTFERALARYGGDAPPPPFVVRTLFQARWNVAHGLEPTDGLAQVERWAYWGWLALEAVEAPPARRLRAAEGYAEAGGPAAAEARATLLFQAGRYLEAGEAFERAYRDEGGLRLRNHALAALELAAP